ncbi:MAG: hypothetical protein IPK19_19490 [Chloroflexi bacterium]|nr:hypothetical protein [Chloroflexota bacterium]
MKTLTKSDGTTASFVLADVDLALHEAVRGLFYQPTEDAELLRYNAPP